jgi:hypothetical protein
MPMRSFHHRIRRIEISTQVSTHIHPPTHTSHLSAPHVKKKHTDIRPKVRRSLHLDSQIAIYLADDLYRMSNGEMRVLHITHSFSTQTYPLVFLFCFPKSEE